MSSSLVLERVVPHMGFHKDQPCLAISLDLKKAFDRVWIQGLIFKLKTFGLSDHNCKMFLNFLSGRSFQVKINNALSIPKFPLAGVPQGSITGPNFFNTYLSDFPIDWQNNADAIFYADDVLIFNSSRNVRGLISDINAYLEVVHDYLKLWKLKVNESKCEGILIRLYEKFIPNSQKHLKINNNIEIKIGPHLIKIKDQIKYLGVMLHKKASVIPHIDSILKKANGAAELLRNILKNKKMSTKIKEICYKQLIKPIIQYAFPGWCNSSSNQMERLRKFERKILYKCLPHKKARYFDYSKNCYKLIHKKKLYAHFPKNKRLDLSLFEQFLKFYNNIKFSDMTKLKDICSEDILENRFLGHDPKFKFKNFPPSYLFYLYQIKETNKFNDTFTFYNRRFNTNNLSDFIYDLLEPD